MRRKSCPAKKWMPWCYSCVQRLSGGGANSHQALVTLLKELTPAAKLSFWHRTLSSEVQHCPEASIAKKNIIHYFWHTKT